MWSALDQAVLKGGRFSMFKSGFLQAVGGFYTRAFSLLLQLAESGEPRSALICQKIYQLSLENQKKWLLKDHTFFIDITLLTRYQNMVESFKTRRMIPSTTN
jgi:hypothetical protein